MSKGINFTPFLPAESTLQPEGLLHTRGKPEPAMPREGRMSYGL